MKYHHVGIPTNDPLKTPVHLAPLKMFVGGYGTNEYGIEWNRYEDDAPYPDLVKTIPHVAFEVADLAQAIEGKKVIIEANQPSPGVLVAFIEENGAPVELLEIDRRVAGEGI